MCACTCVCMHVCVMITYTYVCVYILLAFIWLSVAAAGCRLTSVSSSHWRRKILSKCLSGWRRAVREENGRRQLEKEAVQRKKKMATLLHTIQSGDVSAKKQSRPPQGPALITTKMVRQELVSAGRNHMVGVVCTAPVFSLGTLRYVVGVVCTAPVFSPGTLRYVVGVVCTAPVFSPGTLRYVVGVACTAVLFGVQSYHSFPPLLSGEDLV